MSSTEPTSDESKLERYADELLVGLQSHTPGWVDGVLGARLSPDRAAGLAPLLTSDVDRVLAEVETLLRADIDTQRSSPLALIRSLVPPLTALLRNEDVAPVERDAEAVRLFPDDVFDLTPGSFSDVHPDLHLPGLSWGAAKAHVHLQRRRAEGLR